MSIQIEKAQRVLAANGFDNMSAQALNRLNRHFQACNKRIILVMSHTSTEDFLYGLLLFKACSTIPIKMFTSFKDPLLKKLSAQMGMLTLKTNTSNTQAIIQHLQPLKEFALLISLAKTAANQKVHSGYFFIAQQLKVPIVVLGFDYFLKTGYVSSRKWVVSSTDTYENFQLKQEKEILFDIGNIWPLKPSFQVGFDPLKYHTQNVSETFVPNTPLLFANVAKECFPKQTAAVIATLVVFIALIVLLVYLLVFKKKKQNNTNKT
jgi:hypothetical protein